MVGEDSTVLTYAPLKNYYLVQCVACSLPQCEGLASKAPQVVPELKQSWDVHRCLLGPEAHLRLMVVVACWKMLWEALSSFTFLPNRMSGEYSSPVSICKYLWAWT